MKKIKNLDKKAHKFLIWAVIWTAIVWFGFWKWKEKKWFLRKIKNFFSLGYKELKKFFKKRK
jgi:hypothetical protein